MSKARTWPVELLPVYQPWVAKYLPCGVLSSMSKARTGLVVRDKLMLSKPVTDAVNDTGPLPGRLTLSSPEGSLRTVPRSTTSSFSATFPEPSHNSRMHFVHRCRHHDLDQTRHVSSPGCCESTPYPFGRVLREHTTPLHTCKTVHKWCRVLGRITIMPFFNPSSCCISTSCPISLC